MAKTTTKTKKTSTKQVKELPKSQKEILTYFEKGVPLYKVTTTKQNDVYYLYGVDEDGFTLLKQKKDPLFPECGY